MSHPFADFGDVIDCLGAKNAITVERYGTGSYSATTGDWVPGAVTNIAMDAVVHPAPGDQIERLPENQRTNESIEVFTTTALQTAAVNGSGQADVIQWAGKRYEVSLVDDREHQALYGRAVAVRIGE